jgi:hypothetical protein
MIIVGTAKNISKTWTETSKSLQKIFDSVENYICVIVESNSSDTSLLILKNWAKMDFRRTIISMGNLSGSRTSRIAKCRNKYMETIEPFFNDHSEVLMVDLDCCLQIDDDFKEQLHSCFLKDDWEAVASNRRGRYYDIWALRSTALGIDYDCWEMAKKYNDKIKYVYSHQKKIREDSEWIPCQSAFGCMALYKSEAIKGRRYDDGTFTCEHVAFNKGLKIFINPCFISGGDCCHVAGDTMESIFTNIYRNSKWGNNNAAYKGSSNSGSSVEYNIKEYIPFLKNFIQTNCISSVIDLGCGDFRCGKSIYDDLNVTYYGYDTYYDVVKNNKTTFSRPKYNFDHLDFFSDKHLLRSGDLCILKDVIQHWNLSNIYTFLDYLTEKKLFKYILIINCCNQKRDNSDIKLGDFQPLSCTYLPLKKYMPTKLLNYGSKEVSVIEPFK